MMIWLISMALGVTTTALHSTFSVVSVALAILVTFALADIMSAGAVPFFMLVVAILGYNLGILLALITFYGRATKLAKVKQ